MEPTLPRARPGAWLPRLERRPGARESPRLVFGSPTHGQIVVFQAPPAAARWREGRYFFLGDDRVQSCDSRVWGTVPRSSLIGPVVATYWPSSRIGLP